eukprot:3845260-Rhodomonas_salina.1
MRGWLLDHEWIPNPQVQHVSVPVGSRFQGTGFQGQGHTQPVDSNVADDAYTASAWRAAQIRCLGCAFRNAGVYSWRSRIGVSEQQRGLGLGFTRRVYGLGSRVYCLGVSGAGSTVQALLSRMEGAGSRVKGARSRVYLDRVRIEGLGSRV